MTNKHNQMVNLTTQVLKDQKLTYEELPMQHLPTFLVHYLAYRRGADFSVTVQEHTLRMSCYINLFDMQSADFQRKLSYANDANRLSELARFHVVGNDLIAACALPLPDGDSATIANLIYEAVLQFTMDLESVYGDYIMSD